MDSYDSESRRIFQHFSRSTSFTILCTAQISKFQQKIVKFHEISFHSRFSMNLRFCENFMKYSHFFIVVWKLRAMGVRRGGIRISMRLKISMRWVPAERRSKAEKNVFLRNPPGRARILISMRRKISVRWVSPRPKSQ